MDFENTLSTVDEVDTSSAVDAGTDAGAGNGSQVIVVQGEPAAAPQQSTMLDPPTLESAGCPMWCAPYSAATTSVPRL